MMAKKQDPPAETGFTPIEVNFGDQTATTDFKPIEVVRSVPVLPVVEDEPEATETPAPQKKES